MAGPRVDPLQVSPAAAASLKAFQQFQPACTHFSLIYISPTRTVSHLGPVPQGGIPSRGCCSCLAVLCHQRAPSLQALRVLNLWEGICSWGYTTCPVRAHFWHVLNVISTKSQRVMWERWKRQAQAYVSRNWVGSPAAPSLRSSGPAPTKPNPAAAQHCDCHHCCSLPWVGPASFFCSMQEILLVSRYHRQFRDGTGCPFISEAMPGTCLPTNSQRGPGGSRDSSAGRREIRDWPLALFKKVPFTAFPSGNLKAPAH